MKTTPNSKRILAYGDSITWGRVPGEFTRHPENVRWTGVLQQKLGDTFDVIEEGCRGRLVEGENPEIPDCNGLEQFGPILASQFPVDLIILFLGTNDTCAAVSKSVEDIADSLSKYKDEINEWCTRFHMAKPKLLLVAPPHVDEEMTKGDAFKGAGMKTMQFAGLYKDAAAKLGAYFIDSAQHCGPSPVDGIHLDRENNSKLGDAVAEAVVRILGQ